MPRTMTITITKALLGALAVLLLGGVLAAPPAFAHPEDEFCVPGEDGLDPALCRALSELDSADTTADLSAAAESLRVEDIGRSWGETLLVYIRIGAEHILPGGMDHILFVLALFLASERLRALLWQVSAFTLAHTATLGLTAAGVIAPSSAIIEPLIALTIAWAALENILFKDMKAWRPLLVFGFGLIHGMGFAGAFGELGLPDAMFWPALVGFNIGVEVGQLMVIGMAFAVALGIKGALRRTGYIDRYRMAVTLPISALIGVIGLWWAIERALLAG